MSIKGGAYRWLKQALEPGDLPLVKASAAQLPAIDLPTALDIALLVIEQEPHNASARPCGGSAGGRFSRGRRRFMGLLEATVAMSALAQETERWEAVLRELVKRAS